LAGFASGQRIGAELRFSAIPGEEPEVELYVLASSWDHLGILKKLGAADATEPRIGA